MQNAWPTQVGRESMPAPRNCVLVLIDDQLS